MLLLCVFRSSWDELVIKLCGGMLGVPMVSRVVESVGCWMDV